MEECVLAILFSKAVTNILTFPNKPQFTVILLYIYEVGLVSSWHIAIGTWNPQVEVLCNWCEYDICAGWAAVVYTLQLTWRSTPLTIQSWFLLLSDSAEWKWWQWLCCVSLVWEPSSLAESVLMIHACAAVVRWGRLVVHTHCIAMCRLTVSSLLPISIAPT